MQMKLSEVMITTNASLILKQIVSARSTCQELVIGWLAGAISNLLSEYLGILRINLKKDKFFN